jgi:hypothetical protein
MSRGEQNIHIYQIELEPYENGHFYRRDDGILTLVADREFPYRPNRISIVSGTINTNTSIGNVAFRKIPLSYTCEQDRILIPTFGIIDEEWDSEITVNIIAALQSARGIYDDNYSVFVTRKKFEDNIWEVGLAVTHGYGAGRFVRNKNLERYIGHLLDFGEL